MKRLLVVLVLLAVAGGAGYWLYNAPSGKSASFGPQRGGKPDGNTPVPVLAAKAETRDVPIYLDALGTVQAYNLVSIRAMIDGPLVDVRFREGQDVKQGDLLALIDPRPTQAALDSALARKQQDEATLANARLDAVRYAKLGTAAGSSLQQIDTQRSLVAQLEAQVRGDQAQIDTARTNLSYTSIVAPISGRTGLRQVDVGNIVHASDVTPITVLTQLQPIYVVFTLPQQSLSSVAAAMQNGQPEALAMSGDDMSRMLDTGRLAVLDNQVDQSTGTIKLKASFPNAALTLWPGGFVNVRLLVEMQRGVTTVPAAAVQRGPSGPYVFIIQPDNTVTRQLITVGHEDQSLSIVTAGLQPGDSVVTDGAQRLTDKAKVAIAGPDGNAPAAIAKERSAPGTAQRGRTRSAS